MFLCLSRGATSQTPAMSRTLLLLLLLLRGLAAGRPPPAATPRLKLSFPGEHGTRAGRGVWGQVWVRCLRVSSTQHRPEGWEYPGGQHGGRGAKPQPWHISSTAAAFPAGCQVLVLAAMFLPDASPPRATCLSLRPHFQPPACGGSGASIPVCTRVALPSHSCAILLGMSCPDWPLHGLQHGAGGFVQRRVSARALLPA